MSRKFFGTDGIRGRVGQAPMTPDFALKLGWAAGCVLARSSGAHVVVGKDTRRSGYLFESALEAGFAAAGVETHLLGPLPTPAVAYLTRALRAQAGVVISASHNPHFDNGVKFFSGEGDKLSDELELRIEEQMQQDLVCVVPELLGRARRIDDAAGRYIEFCKSSFGHGSLKGMRLVVDCANGAAYRVGPAVFSELGAEVIAIGDRPNGLNINQQCGSTHIDGLRKAVVDQGAQLGIALDGDGDRCLLVTAEGVAVDGDEVLYVIACHRRRTGALRGPVVGTVMSNLGLQHALATLGIEFERAAVGDRYVLEKMRASGGILGGETSGHTICLDRTTTGDGIVTALQVLAAMQEDEAPLTRLVAPVRKYPQVLLNVPVAAGAAKILQSGGVQSAVEAAERTLGQRGRVLLRASGTEPLIRVMVEAQEAAETEQLAQDLARAVREAGA